MLGSGRTSAPSQCRLGAARSEQSTMVLGAPDPRRALESNSAGRDALSLPRRLADLRGIGSTRLFGTKCNECGRQVGASMGTRWKGRRGQGSR